jgi:hypothetical protein
LGAADVGVNLYGLSYHFDRARARYRVAHGERLQWIFDAGAYRDSGRNTAS